jgi:CRP-like cAMP-binding protein
MAILDPAARLASAESIGLASLLRLDRSDLDTVFDEQPELARSLIRTLTRTLRSHVVELAALRAQLDEGKPEGGSGRAKPSLALPSERVIRESFTLPENS